MIGFPSAVESDAASTIPPLSAASGGGNNDLVLVTLGANGGAASFTVNFGACLGNHINNLTNLVVGPPGLPADLSAPVVDPERGSIPYCWVQEPVVSAVSSHP